MTMNLEKLSTLANDLPDPYKANALALIERMGTVLEGIGDEGVAWRPNTTRLVQGTSDIAKLPKGAGVGTILNGENILGSVTKGHVLRTWTARQMWSPDQNEAKMLCSSPDGELGYIGLKCKECPHQVYDADTKKVECNKIIVSMWIAEDLSDIWLTQFAKTGYKTGTDLQMMMKKAGVATYRRIYGLTSDVGKQYKNVAAYRIETYDKDDLKNTKESNIPFLTELFTQVSAERTEHVKTFHQIVLARKTDVNLLANNSSADSEVVLIEGSPAEAKTETKAEAKHEKSTSPLAKKYDLS